MAESVVRKPEAQEAPSTSGSEGRLLVVRSGPPGSEANKLTDVALAERMIAGDEAAFETFCDRYLPALHRFAKHRLGHDMELTRDIVQSTVCKAIAKLDTYRGEAALMTWLCACCRNEIAGHYRKLKWQAPEVDIDDLEGKAPAWSADESRADAEGALVRKETGALVHMTLDLLPTRYARVLEWKYLEGRSVREIAGELDTGEKAAESLLTRARRAFEQHYRELVESLGESREQGAESSPRRSFEL